MDERTQRILDDYAGDGFAQSVENALASTPSSPEQVCIACVLEHSDYLFLRRRARELATIFEMLEGRKAHITPETVLSGLVAQFREEVADTFQP